MAGKSAASEEMAQTINVTIYKYPSGQTAVAMSGKGGVVCEMTRRMATGFADHSAHAVVEPDSPWVDVSAEAMVPEFADQAGTFPPRIARLCARASAVPMPARQRHRSVRRLHDPHRIPAFWKVQAGKAP